VCIGVWYCELLLQGRLATMAPSGHAMPGLAIGAGIACIFQAGYSFVGAPTSGVRNLRATDVQLSPQAPPAAGSTSSMGVLAASSAAVSLLVAAGATATKRSAAARRAEKGKELAEATIPRPEDLLESPKFPLYMGASGGYMSRATKERHAITWTAKEESVIELPTGVAAIMNKGENLCYFRKKEQCLSVGKELRKRKIENYKIYRIAKDGTVTFMHPADGVFPEKVNKGRVQVNGRPFSIGRNATTPHFKGTKYHMKAYEADPLSTMFVKARVRAFSDVDNLFAIPQPTGMVAWEEQEGAEKSM